MKKAWLVAMAAAIAGIFAVVPAHAGLLVTGNTGTVGLYASAFAIDTLQGYAVATSTPADSYSPSVPIYDSAQAGLAYSLNATNFGVNKVTASAGPCACVNAGDDFFAGGQSIWTDEFLITGGTGTGALNIGVHIDGSETVGAAVQYDLIFNNNFSEIAELFADSCLDVSPYASCSADGEYTDNYTFTYGVPFLISGSFYGDVGVGEPANTEFSLDFGSTAVLNELVLPQGATLQTASGTTYPIASDAIAVPEPATLALFGAGLAGAAALRRRKKAQKA